MTSMVLVLIVPLVIYLFNRLWFHLHQLRKTLKKVRQTLTMSLQGTREGNRTFFLEALARRHLPGRASRVAILTASQWQAIAMHRSLLR